VSFGDGDTQSDQERSGWKDWYKAFDECYTKEAQDTASSYPRNQISEGVHSFPSLVLAAANGLKSSASQDLAQPANFSGHSTHLYCRKISALASSPARHRSNC